jgi:hypothetical protein
LPPPAQVLGNKKLFATLVHPSIPELIFKPRYFLGRCAIFHHAGLDTKCFDMSQSLESDISGASSGMQQQQLRLLNSRYSNINIMDMGNRRGGAAFVCLDFSLSTVFRATSTCIF